MQIGQLHFHRISVSHISSVDPFHFDLAAEVAARIEVLWEMECERREAASSERVEKSRADELERVITVLFSSSSVQMVEVCARLRNNIQSSQVQARIHR